MSVYKIFPSKDATIYSTSPTINAGRDEVLEISSINNRSIIGITPGSDDIRRTLIAFSNEDLSAISQYTSSYHSIYLRLYLAYASALPLDYTVECFPVSESWTMGTGKFADSPNPKNGVSWYSVGAYGDSANWSTSPGAQSYLYTTGGGTWNSSSIGTETFDYISNKDLSINVTPIVAEWLAGTIPNNGFIVKLNSEIELDPSSSLETKFFSMDTHTIYPPCLEIRWDDSVYNTGSSGRAIVTQDDFVLLAENNLGDYKEGTKYRMKFKVRDRYPVRTFTTSSAYLNWKYLPEESYWAIQDYKTKEVIIDFDTSYTRLSADNDGNYFILYTNGLQPERSYKILVKTLLADTEEEVVIDNDIIFKINR